MSKQIDQLSLAVQMQGQRLTRQQERITALEQKFAQFEDERSRNND